MRIAALALALALVAGPWSTYCAPRCGTDDDCEGGSGCMDLLGRGGVLHCAS